MREKVTVTIEDETIKQIEEIRTESTNHPRKVDNKSHFYEKLLIIGMHSYKQKQKFALEWRRQPAAVNLQHYSAKESTGFRASRTRQHQPGRPGRCQPCPGPTLPPPACRAGRCWRRPAQPASRPGRARRT